MRKYKYIVLSNKKPTIHGHRGCHGYFPENSVEGFLYALNFNIEAVEMDIVITADNQIIVTHDLYVNPDLCLNHDGSRIEHHNKMYFYQMEYKEIKQLKTGLISQPRFPFQRNIASYIPLLSEVVDLIENEVKNKQLKVVSYNIEIKCDNQLPGIAQPDYKTYASLVLQSILNLGIGQKVIIQSFDKAMLREIRNINTTVPVSLLIEDEISPFEHINELGFKPEMIGVDFRKIKLEDIIKLHKESIKVFVFTVNENADIRRMIDYRVNTIITDYPDRVEACFRAY